MRIVDLTQHKPLVAPVARLLVDGFADTGSVAWRTLDEALETVQESMQDAWVSRVAVADGDGVLGWIGGSPQYGVDTWELHPLVVRRDRRRQGIGRALVEDLEEQVRRRGGTTLYLGADDEDGRTSIGGVDLYPDVLAALDRIENRRDHPFGFYRKLGFVIVGAIPDANGWGKPDILMAKRIAVRT